MRGGTNAQQTNLPRNGIGYHLCVFGSNIFDGYYRAWISMPNADKVTVELIGMGVIGESWWDGSTLASKTQIFTDPWGVYINCNDSSVVGKSCNPQIRVTGGGRKLNRLLRLLRRRGA